MGTETSYGRKLYRRHNQSHVKLKNPLMGTETRDVFHHIPRI